REGGGHVEVERAFEEAFAGVEKWPGLGAADVVDDDVDPAELAHRRVDESVQVVGVAQIARHDRGAPTPLGDGAGDLLELFFGAGRDDDVGAGFGQGQGGRGPDTASRPGDDGCLVGQAETVEEGSHAAIV